MEKIIDKHLDPCACFKCLKLKKWAYDEFDQFYYEDNLSSCDQCNESAGAHDGHGKCPGGTYITYFTNKKAKKFRSEWKS